jgi:hypothetical protein
MTRPSPFPVVRLAVLLGLLAAGAASQKEPEIVAVSGEASSVPSGVYISFGSPALTNGNGAVFSATVSGPVNVIYSGTKPPPDGIELTDNVVPLALPGGLVSSGNGTLVNPGNLAQGNNKGRTVFSSTLTGTLNGALDNQGLFVSGDNTSMDVVRKGDSAPDGSGEFSSFLGNPVINNSEQVAFRALLVNTPDSEGLFLGSAGSVTKIARKNDSAPDHNGKFSTFSNVAISNQPSVAFRGTLTATSGGNVDNSGIYRSSSGGLSQIARKGQAAPGGTNTFTGFDDSPAVNRHGEVAFTATLSGNSAGVFLGTGTTLFDLARKFQSAPDGNGTYSVFAPGMALSNSGKVAFVATLTGTAAGANDDQGLYLATTTSVLQVAREGQAAPDGNGVFNAFNRPYLNHAGKVAFLASLRSTTGGSADNLAICLYDPIHGLMLVTRTGASMDFSTITALQFGNGVPTSDDAGSPLNDAGETAMHFTLQDGRTGIAISESPSPNWTDLGYAKIGTHAAPRLTGSGSLLVGEPMEIQLWNALETTPAFRVIGFANLSLPFKGGKLVPNISLLVTLVTDAQGGLLITSPWPAGVPAGFKVYFQTWITDPAASFNLAASNGLQGKTL